MKRREFTKVAAAVAAATVAGKAGTSLIDGDAPRNVAASHPPAQPQRVAPAPTSPRSVERIVVSQRTLEGAGFPVRRPFPTRALRHFDPFVLIDEMGPVTWGPGKALGAPDHPHRGFETVSYILEGSVQHADSLGHRGILGPGGVQWMTAGSGIVHAEEPPPAFKRDGGRMHGFQLWVNLPAKLKLTKPRYQEMQADEFPEATTPDGLAKVRVIAGEALGVRSRIDVHTPIIYQHWLLQPGAKVTQSIPADHNACLYVFGGAGTSGPDDKSVTDGDLAIYGPGDAVTLHVPRTAKAPLQALLLAGQPHGDPIVQYGPFVMNNMAQIQQAYRDYQAGKMGEIAPT
ncbi:MAG: pirin family protein [Myxococcales bacterium]|nr:pirin family protein [Myxococcales bacterium]